MYSPPLPTRCACGTRRSKHLVVRGRFAHHHGRRQEDPAHRCGARRHIPCRPRSLGIWRAKKNPCLGVGLGCIFFLLSAVARHMGGNAKSQGIGAGRGGIFFSLSAVAWHLADDKRSPCIGAGRGSTLFLPFAVHLHMASNKISRFSLLSAVAWHLSGNANSPRIDVGRGGTFFYQLVRRSEERRTS